MTLTDFDEFVSMLYVTMPGQRKWVTENSPDPDATHGVWFKALRDYSLDECNNVLEEIQLGRLKIENYERDHVHTIIRGRIQNHRAISLSEAHNAKILQSVSDRRRNYKSPLADMHAYFLRINLVSERWKAGEMSREEMNNMHAAIIRQYQEEDAKKENARAVESSDFAKDFAGHS